MESSAQERKYSLAMILATKTIKIGVKLFLLMSRANIRGFFYFKIAKNNRYDLGKKNYFELISSFEMFFF